MKTATYHIQRRGAEQVGRPIQLTTIPIAEIIHDIDLKDDKYGRQEAAGLNILFSGLFMAHSTDEKRIMRGTTILDDMFEYFKRQKVN